MEQITCKFEGIDDARIVFIHANGNDIYIWYEDGTDTIKLKKMFYGDGTNAIQIAENVTEVQ